MLAAETTLSVNSIHLSKSIAGVCAVSNSRTAKQTYYLTRHYHSSIYAQFTLAIIKPPKRKASPPERRKSHFTSLQLLHSSGPCTNPEEMRLETLLTKDGNPRTSHFPISTVKHINSRAPLPCLQVSPPQNQSAVHTYSKSQGRFSLLYYNCPDCCSSYSFLYTMESHVQVIGFCCCFLS